MDDEDQIPEPLSDAPTKLFGPSIAEPSPPPRPSGGEGACDADVEEGRGCGMESGLDDESDDEGEEENGDLQKTDQQDAAAGTNDGQKSEAGAQEKTLKKPDKIIPCPRCASMDTKFCYFNNYKANQPRYFCRKCQRYWTSGGTMRNLPVGAGRRKSKCSAPQRQQMEVPRDFQTVSTRGSNGVVAHNGSVPQVSSPKGVEKASRLNGLGKPKELKISSSHETVVDGSRSGSAGSGSNIENEGQATARAARGYQSFQPHMLCFPAPLWPPFPWNPAQYNCPLPSPIIYPPGFPVPFYPCVPGAWNVPLSAHPSSPSLQSESKSPTLGKHSRDDIDNAAKPGNTQAGERPKEGNPKPSIWVPKTVRMDDLEEAAKSSMWATLGIKYDNILQSNGKGHLNPFSSLAVETERSRPVSSTSSALLANPAALSRSMNFHESSST